MDEPITWGEAFRESCSLCRNPAPLLQSLLPVPVDAPANQLAMAWRGLLELDVQSLSVSLRPAAYEALRQVGKRIFQLPGSDADAGLILLKDFERTSVSVLERPKGFQGPEAPSVVVAKLSGLPDGHFLHSLLRQGACWADANDEPCFVLGSVREGRLPAFFLEEDAKVFTKAYARHQNNQERLMLMQQCFRNRGLRK